MITYLITGITVVVSFICFNNRLLFDKLSLKPYRIVHAKEWYRIISHGFVHADWVHLFVNMFTFWSFGKYIEETFRYLGFGEGAFLLLYFGGMVVASASDVIDKIIEGETVADVLEYVQFTPKRMARTVEVWATTSVKKGIISPEEGREFLSNYRSGLYGYTYLE